MHYSKFTTLLYQINSPSYMVYSLSSYSINILFFKLVRLHWNFLYFSLKLLHFVNVSDQCCSNFLKTEPWKSPDKEYFNFMKLSFMILIFLFIDFFFNGEGIKILFHALVNDLKNESSWIVFNLIVSFHKFKCTDFYFNYCDIRVSSLLLRCVV